MSKKVAYITRHAIANYGSALQTYATQTAIEKLGYEAVCINYIKTDELPCNLLKTRLFNSSWNKNALTRLFYTVTKKSVLSYETKRFAEYIKDLIKVTSTEYHSVEELESNLPEADVYMTGSDQVWNFISYKKIDSAYFLSFVDNAKKKIAYAASFGGKNIQEDDRDNIKKWLSGYDAVSIRENSGVKIAEELGINATQVLDPTLLMDSNDWSKLMPTRTNDEKYVLVYQLQPNKSFEKYAKEFAKRKNLKLLRVNPSFNQFFKCGKFICCPPLGDFIWYVKNAEYFLTDSFHGTAFAINLNTQFVDILPNKYSERNRSILQLVGLENRILESYDDFSVADTPIDFKYVNKVIDVERKKSMEVLKNMIES